MNSLMAISKSAKHLVGFTALVATVFTLGGPLVLAEHYAHSGPGEHATMATETQAKPAVGKQARMRGIADNPEKLG